MNNELDWSLNENATLIRIDFPSDPPVRLEFDADEVDAMIARLSAMRQSMVPAIPMSDPDPGTRIEVSLQCRYYVERVNQGRQMMVAMLHPGVRWIGMLFGRIEAQRLIDTILQNIPDDDQPDPK